MRLVLVLTMMLLTLGAPVGAQIPGDMNCDGVVDDGDCPEMTLAMTDPAGWAATFPGCLIDNADMNDDGLIDCADYPLFLDAVASTTPTGCGWAYSECPMQPYGAFAVANGTDNESEPDVACDWVLGTCLVVWWEVPAGGDQVIAGRFVGYGGLPFGEASFVIDSGSEDRVNPSVEYDHDRGRFLVVWSQRYPGPTIEFDVYGRFVPLAGPDPALTPFQIAFTTSDERNPDLALADGTDEFLVVWTSETPTGSRIEGRRVLADGSGTVGGEFVVTDGPEDRWDPSLIWDRRNDRYLLAYVRGDSSSYVVGDVWLRRMTWTGAVIGAETGIAAWPGAEIEPAVGVLRGDPLVAWLGDAETYVRWIGDDGLPVGPPINLHRIGASWDEGPSVACHDVGNECRVVWHDTELLTGAVLRSVRRNGLIGPVEEIRRPPLTHGWDVWGLASAMVIDRLLVVWAQDGPDDWDVFARVQPTAIFGDGFESGDDGWWGAK